MKLDIFPVSFNNSTPSALLFYLITLLMIVKNEISVTKTINSEWYGSWWLHKMLSRSRNLFFLKSNSSSSVTMAPTDYALSETHPWFICGWVFRLIFCNLVENGTDAFMI